MLSIENLSKRFQVEGGFLRAVDHISLEVPQGKFFTLLGPSGCGKTTTLRCVAGLEFPDEGEIRIGDRAVFSSSRGIAMLPEEREIGMVFQSYAIWPHMTVFQNVAFPLRVGRRRLPSQEIREKVGQALSLVQLEGLADRPSTRLSGGQQQRVALARALVAQPQLLLLDEPLSNLDAKLREEMRIELRQLQTSLGITTIYVTHDQTEALAMSDMIAVMHDGKIVQLGTAKEIYERPIDPFTIAFVGSTNLISGTVQAQAENGLYLVATDGGAMRCVSPRGPTPESMVLVSIRPEDVEIHLEIPPAGCGNTWSGEVKRFVYLGDHLQCEVAVGEHTVIKAKIHPRIELRPSQKVHLSFDPYRCVAVPA